MVLCADRQKCVDPLPKARGVLLPQKIVQEYAHGIHANVLSPAKLLVDLLRIEGVFLPHFQFVDGTGRNVVAADQPWLLLVPSVRFGLTPPRALGRSRSQQSCASSQQNKNVDRMIQSKHEISPGAQRQSESPSSQAARVQVYTRGQGLRLPCVGNPSDRLVFTVAGKYRQSRGAPPRSQKRDDNGRLYWRN